MADAKKEKLVALPGKLVGAGEVPVEFVNNVVIQNLGNDEFVLTFGHATLPILVGSTEEIQKQALEIGFAPIKPVCRLAMNRKRVEELIEICQRNLGRTEK